MPKSQKRTWIICAIILALYVLVRVAFLPRDPLHADGFAHDSAYLTIVARNLLAGKGFVLDALWLVPLLPAHLPMPYHNANPLFPVLLAGIGYVCHIDLVTAGFLISALSSAGVFLALAFLIQPYVNNYATAFGVAALTALWPPIWGMSWIDLTDELWLALVLAALAALVRSSRWSMAVLAGCFWALAWLVRAPAVIVLPAIVLWLWMTFPLRQAILRFAVFGAAASLVASPWLIHTAQVWGSPLRSDGDIVMASHLCCLGDESAPRVRHMPKIPEPPVEIIRNRPGHVAMLTLRGGFKAARQLIAAATDSKYIATFLLALLTWSALVASRPIYRTPSFLSAVAYIAILFVSLAPLSVFFEPRYFLLGYAFWGAWIFYAVYRAWCKFRAGVRSASNVAILAAAVLYAAFLIPYGYRSAAVARAPGQEQMDFMRVAGQVNQTVSHGTPVVVGYHPYFYTVATGAQSMAIPEADDNYLREYMNRYGSHYVLLSEEERKYWRPAWEKSLPAGIYLREKIGDYYLFELRDP